MARTRQRSNAKGTVDIMAGRPAGVAPYGYTTVELRDINDLRTQKRFENRAATTLAEAIEIAEALQAITQLEVVDVLFTQRVVGWAPIAAEANSSVAETANVKVRKADGGEYTFVLPAVKQALKNGSQINGSNADLKSFLEYFDDGAGVLNVVGDFYVSDGEEISEAFHEDNLATGVVNK